MAPANKGALLNIHYYYKDSTYCSNIYRRGRVYWTLKIFKILSDVIPLKLKKSVNSILCVCARARACVCVCVSVHVCVMSIII